MISDETARIIDGIFHKHNINPGEGHTNIWNVLENIEWDVINLVSELEEECTALREKVERLEHDLGLTGIEGDKRD